MSEGLSIASLVVSLLTAAIGFCLGFVYWFLNRKDGVENRQLKNTTDMKAKYKDVVASVDYITYFYWLCRREIPQTYPWKLVYQGLGSDLLGVNAPSAKEKFDSWLRLCEHRSKVDSYWEDVVTLHELGELPGFFKAGGGWLKKADNYRYYFEPLNIANFYRAEFDLEAEDPRRSYMSRDPVTIEFLKRPKRYWYIEKQVGLLEPRTVVRSSIVWADRFETALGAPNPQNRADIDLSSFSPWVVQAVAQVVHDHVDQAQVEDVVQEVNVHVDQAPVEEGVQEEVQIQVDPV